jgi:hypothetical protein
MAWGEHPHGRVFVARLVLVDENRAYPHAEQPPGKCTNRNRGAVAGQAGGLKIFLIRHGETECSITGRDYEGGEIPDDQSITRTEA